MVFDPDQDPEEKRGVRKSYRSLTKKIEGARFSGIPFLYTISYSSTDHKGNPNDFTTEELLSQVHQADQLFNKGRFHCLTTFTFLIFLGYSQRTTRGYS